MIALFFAVSLTIMQAAPPIPRHAPNSANQTADNSKKKPAENKEPIAPPLPAENIAQKSFGEKATAQNPASPNTEQTVRVREFPSVSVSRDWADWMLWGASALLAIVGIVGICVAVRTLKAIRIQSVIMRRQTRHIARQALSMRRQTTHLKNSVVQAENAAKSALLNAQAYINSERPWMEVAAIPNNTLSQPGYFFFRVTNTGRTPAQFVSGGFAFSFQQTPNGLPIPAMYAPLFAPNARLYPPGSYFDIQRSLSEAPTGISLQSIIQERQKELGPMTDILFIYGNIVYDDVLGKDRPGYKPHETRWCFAYFPNGMRIVRTGPDGENGREYNDYT